MKHAYMVYICCGILLLPTVFFPISSDAAVFVMGGKTIADGGQIYGDFLDLKAPAIYEIFALLYKTIGVSSFAVHSYDYLLQLSTCILIFLILDKKDGKSLTGGIAACVYALLYTISDYTTTLQAESYVGVSICAAYFLLEFRKTIFKMFLLGVISGFLFSLKFTFGIVGGALFVFLLADKSREFGKRILDCGYFILGVVVSTTLLFIPLMNYQTFSEYLVVLDYLKYYASLMPSNASTIKMALKTMGTTFGDLISLTVSCAAAYGVSLMLGCNAGSPDKNQKKYYWFFLFGALLFISLAVEKRFTFYHFLRLYAPLSVFAGLGLATLWYKSKLALKGDFLSKTIAASVLVAAIVVSPLPRYLNLIPPSIYYFTSNEKYIGFYQRDNGLTLYREYDEAAKYLDGVVPKSSLAMVIATGSCQINYIRRNSPYSKFAQSQFLMGSFKVPKWHNEFDSELGRAAALAVQTDDVHPTITGFNGGSYDWLRRSEYWNYVNSHFKEIKRIGSFVIFRRTAS